MQNPDPDPNKMPGSGRIRNPGFWGVWAVAVSGKMSMGRRELLLDKAFSSFDRVADPDPCASAGAGSGFDFFLHIMKN